MAATAPSVDLNDLSTDDPSRLDRAAAAIREGYGDFGLVAMAGHGISPELIDAFFGAYLRFTQQPDEAKAKLNLPDIWYQRGWTPPNTERAVVAGGQPDFKECYFAAPEPLDPIAASFYPEILADNVWPDHGFSDFQAHFLDVGHRLHAVGLLLLRGAERALGLDEGTFDAITQGAAHNTRALRYLPLTQSEADAGILWGEEHTDFNLLTILGGGRFFASDGSPVPRPDDRAGLYLRTRPTADAPRGRMIRGVPPEGHLVSQVGQQLEILTGGTFLATPHVIKAPQTPGVQRTSLAHFIHVHPMQPLAPLPPFRSPEAIEAYRPPVLAGTYAVKTLVDIGLAPPRSLDRMGYRHYERLADIRAHGEW